jgi:hypothetical protein
MLTDKRTVREHIVEAIIAGFEGQCVLEVNEDDTLVYVIGYREPIKVLADNLEIPDEFASAADAIRLDIRALLATLREKE